MLEVFKVDPETQQSKYPIASQILMIYYVLLYHDCYLSNLRALSESFVRDVGIGMWVWPLHLDGCGHTVLLYGNFHLC